MEGVALLMDYHTTKSGKLISTELHEIYSDKDICHVLIADNIEHLKRMVKTTIESGLKKYHQLTWNKGRDTEISIFRDKEYSDYPEEHSKTITYLTKTVSKNRIIETNKIVKPNPTYIDNPECEFCYNKTTLLYKDNLLDKNKTEKMVCSKCKKQLSLMRKIIKEKNL